MKPDQAVRPDFFNSLPTIVKDQRETEQGLTDEEQHLYNLSHHAGWKVLREYIEGLLKDLDNITDISLSQGLDLEEIGKNAVVANLAKGMIRRILEKVQDAKEAKEKPDGTIK